MQTIDKMLRELRGAKITAREVADAIGVTDVTLSRWRKGIQSPNPDRFEALCKFYQEHANPTYPVDKSGAFVDRSEVILAMLKRGYTHAEIGEIFNITRQRVHAIASKAEEARDTEK